MPADTSGAVFSALADPTRRRLLSAIAAHPGDGHRARRASSRSRARRWSSTSTRSPQAGLLDREREGRDVRYRVTPEPLSDAVTWIAEVGGEWDARLAALRSSLRG